MSWFLPATFAFCTLALVVGVFLIVRRVERDAAKNAAIKTQTEYNHAERDRLTLELQRREHAAREIVRERTDDDVSKRLRDGSF